MTDHTKALSAAAAAATGTLSPAAATGALSVAERSYPSPRSGVAAGRSYPTSEVRGGGREEIPGERGQGRAPPAVSQLREDLSESILTPSRNEAGLSLPHPGGQPALAP